MLHFKAIHHSACQKQTQTQTILALVEMMHVPLCRVDNHVKMLLN